MSAADTPWLYRELADWWHLFSPPSHYVEESKDLLPELLAAPDAPPRTLLELGAGAGSLAYHFKGTLDLTLTDRSLQMLEISKRVNPECLHLLGDMTTMDLGRTFDLVLVHDAIMYATDPESLRAVFATAYKHLRPGGGAVFVPDCVQETFEAGTTTGGEDGPDGRALRYLEWSWDPDPSDHCYEVAWAFLLREADGSVRTETDRHREGLFPRSTWLALMADIGFVARSRLDPWGRDVFAARKPRESGSRL
jgi:SAM-dependent methyltransferase